MNEYKTVKECVQAGWLLVQGNPENFNVSRDDLRT